MTEKNVELIQSIVLPIDEVENNTGQVPGLNANPREITITEYKKLKNSLAKNRGFTALNELKVFPWHGKWITIGGNMRLQAMRELGWAEVIAKPLPEDTDLETLNRIFFSITRVLANGTSIVSPTSTTSTILSMLRLTSRHRKKTKVRGEKKTKRVEFADTSLLLRNKSNS